MSDKAAQLNELNTLIETIESNDYELSVKVTKFIFTQLYDENEPETWKLSKQYARWALAKRKVANRDDISHDCDVCYKNTKWIPQDDGSFMPCDGCAQDRVLQWENKFADSDRPPS